MKSFFCAALLSFLHLSAMATDFGAGDFIKWNKIFNISLTTPGGGVTNVTVVGLLPDLASVSPTALAGSYDPPVTNVTLSTGAPIISEYSRTAEPGDVVALTAENIDSGVGFIMYDGAAILECPILSIDGRQVALAVPEDAAADRSYMLWPVNPNGYGLPVVINKTQVEWVGFSTVTNGETFYVYGKNLIDTNGLSHIYNESLDEWVTSTANSNPYRAEFIMPGTWLVGDHTFRTHNLDGGKYGWSGELTITVEDPVLYNNTTYDVTAYGADGTDELDDKDAINSAFSAAYSGSGKSVYFPAGTYYIDGSIGPWNHNTRVYGDGTNTIIISTSQDAVLSVNGKDDVLIEDMVLVNQFSRQAAGLYYSGGGGRGPTFRRVTFSQMPEYPYDEGQIVQSQGYTDVLFEDCTFLVKCNIFLKSTPDNDNFRFTNCDFLGIWDCNAMMEINADHIDINNCTFANYDDSTSSSGLGWSKGRLVSQAACDYFYFGDNEIVRQAPRQPTPFYTNSVITAVGTLSEYESHWSLGNVRTCTITFADLPDEYNDRGDESTNHDGVMVYLPYDMEGQTIQSYIKDIDTTNNTLTVYIKENAGSAADDINSTNTTWAIFEDIIDDNSGEQLLAEGYKTTKTGTISSGTTTNVILSTASDASSAYSGRLLFITGGTGMGQARRIESGDSGTGEVVVREAFLVAPDSSSTYAIAIGAMSYTVYNNIIEGRADTLGAEHRATTSVQMSASSGMVFESNSLTNMRNAIRLYGYAADEFSSVDSPAPNYFSRAYNNSVDGTARGFRISVYDHKTYGPSNPLAPGDHFALGNVIQRNTMTGITTESAYGLLDEHAEDAAGLNVFALNTVGGFTTLEGESATPFSISDDTGDTLVYKNVFTGHGGIDAVDTAEVTLIGNTWTGFNETYTTNFTKLGVSRTSFLASSDSQSVTIRNLGTVPMDWTSTTGDSGTLQPESETSISFAESSPTSFDIVAGNETQTVYVVSE